tara:strand:- start:631 stop:756 length:126 start_codon:yes stop_codon:yes gene_type:complete
MGERGGAKAGSKPNFDIIGGVVWRRKANAVGKFVEKQNKTP